MTRRPASLSRPYPLMASGLLLAFLALLTSCGGGGIAAREMVLVELQFLDRALEPVAPTGTETLPRNAVIGLVFSEQVNPGSVEVQTIRVRTGPSFQTIPEGSFQVTGNRVLFDPTISAQGQPNPSGLLPVTQYMIEIPGVGENARVIENLDGDPNLSTFFTQFTTADGWLRELRPPQVVEVIFNPVRDGLTKNVPGNGLMGIVFDEPMDPGSFVLGRPTEGGSVDIRYVDDSGPGGINDQNGVADAPIEGAFTPSPDFRTWWFKPLFSWGDAKLVWTVELYQDIKDLSGNGLVNPGSFGPYTSDGNGIETGKVLKETFRDMTQADLAATDADWGGAEEDTVIGQPVTSRQAYIYSYVETDRGIDSGRGQYAPLTAPLIGADINAIVPNLQPPSSRGRRVMWSFSAAKIGPRGAITGIAWGPDSNATFAATYHNVKLRLGYQKDNSLSLSPTFSGNYEGQPALVYDGSYSVQQAANVGNAPGEPQMQHQTGYPMGMGCQGNGDWNQPLFDSTGWYDWPKLTSFFEWDPQGDPSTSERVLLFDASCVEGDSFQQMRGWFGVETPCNGVLIPGLPLSRLRSTYENDDADPTSDIAMGIQNPEQSISDTCFTITRRTSIAQSLFYAPGTGANTTFGDATDYSPALITPSVQAGGATVEIEYQGCDAFDVDPVTGQQVVNQAADFTKDPVTGEPAWVRDINACDGMRNIRYRLRLVSNLISLQVAKVTSVTIPMTGN